MTDPDTNTNSNKIDFSNLTSDQFSTIKNYVLCCVIEQSLKGKTDFIDVLQDAINKVS